MVVQPDMFSRCCRWTCNRADDSEKLQHLAAVVKCLKEGHMSAHCYHAVELPACDGPSRCAQQCHVTCTGRQHMRKLCARAFACGWATSHLVM